VIADQATIASAIWTSGARATTSGAA
jgi:hypothetical protein